VILNADQFEFLPDERCYTEELSLLNSWRLGIGVTGIVVENYLTLLNCPEPGMQRSFRCVRIDRSGDDIAGWRFDEMPGPNRSGDAAHRLNVLIIND